MDPPAGETADSQSNTIIFNTDIGIDAIYAEMYALSDEGTQASHTTTEIDMAELLAVIDASSDEEGETEAEESQPPPQPEQVIS